MGAWGHWFGIGPRLQSVSEQVTDYGGPRWLMMI